MLKILCAGCLDLSKAILLQFILEMCAAAKNCEKFTKTPISFKVIDVNKDKKPVTSACYDMQHVWLYMQPFLHSTSQ